MTIKYYKPYTSTTRHKTILDLSFLSKKKPEKKLTKGFSRKAGRNNQGRLTVRHKGGGHKRLYRTIDFKRDKINVFGKVINIEYDPNRTTNIALINYSDGEKRYILHPDTLKIGDTIMSGKDAPLSIGNSLPLEFIPLGTNIHNIELYPGRGGQIIRAAGTSAKILAKDKNLVAIRLSSKEIRLFQKNCYATIGQLGNLDFNKITIGKAGKNRWKGIRPTVRGSAMNPIDHPHGGGEGRSPIGKQHPVTPWGKPALGVKTRQKRKKSDVYILHKRK